MPSARATALAIAAVAAVALSVVTVAQGCGGRHVLPVAVPSDVHLAEAAASGEPPSAWPAGAAYGATRLEAVRTVALYCRLVDAGQFARAGELCTARRLWSRRAFRAVSRFRFRSARVFAAPDARTLVLKARVRVHARPGRPLPDGLAILFFTLGRAGSAVGGWLITAVSTDP